MIARSTCLLKRSGAHGTLQGIMKSLGRIKIKTTCLELKIYPKSNSKIRYGGTGKTYVWRTCNTLIRPGLQPLSD
ncbi:unnamed protein product [Cuscuta campestris]|uniref:Uncharacterized protein n=1 Tax=Cuscuta campestris TaxID=132261 RepID=A0A484NCN4_9ASTE|nr:unnamed protein product [Cuscuta campestris]